MSVDPRMRLLAADRDYRLTDPEGRYLAFSRLMASRDRGDWVKAGEIALAPGYLTLPMAQIVIWHVLIPRETNIRRIGCARTLLSDGMLANLSPLSMRALIDTELVEETFTGPTLRRLRKSLKAKRQETVLLEFPRAPGGAQLKPLDAPCDTREVEEREWFVEFREALDRRLARDDGSRPVLSRKLREAWYFGADYVAALLDHMSWIYFGRCPESAGVAATLARMITELLRASRPQLELRRPLIRSALDLVRDFFTDAAQWDARACAEILCELREMAVTCGSHGLAGEFRLDTRAIDDGELDSDQRRSLHQLAAEVEVAAHDAHNVRLFLDVKDRRAKGGDVRLRPLRNNVVKFESSRQRLRRPPEESS